MQRKVIIAGGGTGGHIFPAIAIANALKEITNGDIDILFVGAKGKMEMEKVPQAGYRIEGLEIVGFNRSNIFKNILLPFKLIKSLLHAKRILNTFQPDVVVGVGGFASFPMLDRAQRNGIPTLIQEQNSFAGKSNKILSQRAQKICVGYDGMEKFFPAAKILLTGNPVRSSITQSSATRNDSLIHFGLDTKKQTVFVVGGSLGAKSINEAIHAMLAYFVEKDVQLIWQTGKPYFNTAKAAAAPYATQVKVLEFITNMDQAYAAADVVVSRAGALAIAELCVVKKATVFVPYPFAAEDHQTANAMSLVHKKAALLLKDSEVSTQLSTTLFSLLQNKALIEQLEANIAGLANPHADRAIAEEVLKLVR
ncbi:UDP-N-acetylglucosamine-N-acetylmuramylpentapeptide N-acetylglucosamine transferase [Chitinophaga costaii]|uniref:UDP-N-acetylglucosamine--N-acetylmuramyl-(pentapeptide) pyrophosphoryl-undecaprenol N-acetylglucosamine transferase n=1 Tax=Chitinophaga costaii TaxID=1335309 RepID=A0A1C4BTN4_9BACT|nr:undecaprenyldiphospho-muramoylpentapeptide beta-N-acetylglucosaminyltransferase [Chitinophaga costaii]PUZ27474.1 undecaprenyldiphospho-muramoylpentapeptide beta-N-acetylglucosaminyltransferase [Chitinophaga costaii]SCC10271.1 UDP-N-acetylglucosamine-N-acetylmuramylpentapeptide N-acetylglucosamine transferase [Chitinophaga costaii]